jgi:hypothetical protein
MCEVFEQFLPEKRRGEKNFEAQKEEKCSLFTRALALALVTLISRERIECLCRGRCRKS